MADSSFVRKMKVIGDIVRSAWAVASNSGKIPDGSKRMVLIEPTSVCNLACPLCPTGTGTLERENKFISMDVFDKIVEVTAPFAEGYVLNLFGEPSFHPEFAKLLDKVSHLPTWLSTNLSYGKEAARELSKWEHLHIICSIDTLDPEEYPKYRINGDWDKVMGNLEILAQGKCNVYPQFLVSADQTDDTPYLEFAKRFGIPATNIIIKRKLENFRLDFTDEPIPGTCHSAYMGIYFDCDGFMLPCCNNVRKDLRMLNVKDVRSYRDILEHDKVCQIRRKLAQDKNAFPSCGNCEGLNYWHQTLPPLMAGLKKRLLGKNTQQEIPTRMGF